MPCFGEFEKNEQLYIGCSYTLVKLKSRTSLFAKKIRIDILPRFTDVVSPRETLFALVSPVSLRQKVAPRELRRAMSY